MTDNNNKIRALFLTALMVFSVFAGTVAFTGTAAADVGTIDAASASDVTAGADSATQTVAFDVTVQDTADEQITVDYATGNITSASISSVTDTTGNITADNLSVASATSITLDVNGSAASDEGTITLSVTHDLTNVAPADGVEVTIDDAGGTNDATAATPTFDITAPSGSDDGEVVYEADGESGVSLIYSGQTFNATTLQPNTEYQLRSVDETSGDDITSSTFENDYTTNADGELVEISSDGLETGDYFISGPGVTATTNNTLEIVEQQFSAEFADDTVDNEGSTTTDLEIDGNRDGFEVIVDSEDLDYDDDELDDIFGDSFSVREDDEDEQFIIEGVEDGAFETNFSGVDEGQYNFTFEVVDTGVTSDASITVNDVGEGEADLGESSVSVNQGGIATFNVTMNDAAQGGDATVLVGDIGEDGYQANVSVTDGNDDGVVSFNFNTYTAGMNSSTKTVVTLAGDSVGTDDEVELTNKNSEDYERLGDILDTGDYLVSVGVGGNQTVADNPDNVGTFIVNERTAPEQTLWRTSQTTYDDVGDAIADDDVDEQQAILDAIENDQVTQTDTVAIDDDGPRDDILVHQLSAPGLQGLIENASADGDSTTAAFFKATQQDNGFDSDEQALNVVFEEENPGANQDATTVDISEAFTDASDAANSMTVVYDEGEEQYFIFVDAAALEANGFEDGDEVNVDISVQDQRLLNIDETADSDERMDDFQTTSANFSVEAAEIDFDLNADDEIEAVVGDDATVSGTTNVAPGTEFTLRVQSTDDTEPRFIETQTATVQADGTFNASYDLSENAAGDTFEASTQQAAVSASADGVLVESISTETPTPDDGTPTDTATPDDGTPTATATPDEGTPTATATPDEGTPTATQTSTSTPGFGAVLAVIALIGAALLAVRRDN
ncbi:surface glycoprotein [Halobaculum magnesiiphilum]|uniref:Surface glycoprotein n=1 Tax=Halobaculum magnesiiphilum TaxID=1017351 RepID=A0A8T8WGZ5_9EURY|nr:surface glycoprotein [Halobaculum magnesiiphilum]